MNKTALLSLLALSACLLATPVHAQVPGSNAGDGVRFGISFGGISTVSATVELYRGSRSAELSVGTWDFTELSVSVVGRQYIGGRNLRPVVGAGLWVVGRPARASETRSSWALILRAPVGLDWSVADQHALGLFANVNRGLWVRRGNAEDTAPLVGRIVPLPELYYRYAR